MRFRGCGEKGAGDVVLKTHREERLESEWTGGANRALESEHSNRLGIRAGQGVSVYA